MSGRMDNSGLLYKNDRKNQPAQPDVTGYATVDGVEFKVAGWRKKDRNQKDILSLKFTPKDAGGGDGGGGNGGRSRPGDDDDIPF